jgi:uncharacterized protein involved in exopolysaccharide biosynthesis
VFGLLGALGYVLVSPAQYEATAIVQPATVGMPTTTTTTTTTTKGVEVESVAQTLERLKLPTFYDEAMLKACQAPSQQALSGGVKASQVKGNSLIQVSYRARSVAVAEACVNAVVATLARSQAEIAAPIIKTLEEQLSLSRQRLADEKEFQAQAEKRVSGSADGSLLMLKALSKREDIIQLQRQLVDQSVQLSVPITQPVRLLEPIYAPERPVAPKKLPVLAGGLFGGLVLGGLAFFVRRSWLARKAA